MTASGVEWREFDPTYLKLSPFITLAFLAIFKFISPAVSRRVTSCYSQLSPKDQMEWNNRYMSTVASIVTSIMAIYILITAEDMTYEDVWAENVWAKVNVTIITCYMIADTVVMYVWCEMSVRDRIQYTIHHAVGLYGGIVMPGYGVLLYFSMIRMTAEVSNPFMNHRWILDAAGYQLSHPIVIVNGTLMLLTFAFFRMVPMPVFWYQVYYGIILKPDNLVFPVVLNLGTCVVWDMLSTYWFYKICKGYRKALRRWTESNPAQDTTKTD